MHLERLLGDLITANRILAAEGVVDAFGHVSVRHPERPDRFIMSRNRSPQLIELNDLMEFTLDGTPVNDDRRNPYGERFIHAGLYEARPDVHSAVHSHSRSVIPFGITGEKLRPVMHNCATIGFEVPIWDPQKRFGDTDMLVSDMAKARDLAQSVGNGRTVLMRGHGSTIVGKSLREAVYTAIYLEVNAILQFSASVLKTNTIVFLSPGEIEKIVARLDRQARNSGYDKAWENWCGRAGVAYHPE